MKSSHLYLIGFIIILISYIQFFEFRPLHEFSKLLIYAVFIFLIVFTSKNLLFGNAIFSTPVKLIFWSILLAVIPSILFWDQSLFHAIIAVAPFSYFLLFFFLLKSKIYEDQIVKAILTFAYIGMILFFYQYYFTNNVYFGGWSEFNEERGTFRILFPGEGLMFFALFYYLNKLSRKFKLKYIIALTLFLSMMLMQVTRIYILAFGVIAIYHFMIKANVRYRISVIIFFVCGYLFFQNSDNQMIAGLREATEKDIDKKEDYIRFLAADFYLNDFPINEASYMVGNGAYHYSSFYGKKILGLNENRHFYLEDLGLLKGYVLFGIFFILGYFMIFYKSFRLPIPEDKLYLKYYIWMIFILSFTTRAPTDGNFGVVLISVLYLLILANKDFNHLKNQSFLKYKIT